jgi:hypothetical protein
MARVDSATASTAVVMNIRKELAALESRGATKVAIRPLLEYVTLVENAVGQVDHKLDAIALERFRTANEAYLAGYRMTGDIQLEAFRSVLASGQSAMRASMVVNGAAATALLAFVGHLVALPDPRPAISQFASPLLCFVCGVLFSAVGFGVTYVTQGLHSTGYGKAGAATNFAGIALIVASYGGFAAAAWILYEIFRQMS